MLRLRCARASGRRQEEFAQAAQQPPDKKKTQPIEIVTAWLQHRGSRFVRRVPVIDQRVDDDATITRLEQQLARVPFRAIDALEFSARSPLRRASDKKARPAGRARTATLHTRGVRVTLAPGPSQPPYCPPDFSLRRRIAVNLVEVVELDPPQGEEPVRWLLFTSEPIDTPADRIRVAHIYRRRWTVQEFFKSLKTGCKLQKKRQTRSASAFLKAMTFLLPAAWHLLLLLLLLLRALERAHPDLPWTTVLPEPTFRIPCAQRPGARLNEESIVRDVLHAIAGLRGHIKNNGAPGCLTLHRGPAVPLALEQGYLLFEQMNGPSRSSPALH